MNGDEGHDLSTEFYENNARLFLDGGGAEHATMICVLQPEMEVSAPTIQCLMYGINVRISSNKKFELLMALPTPLCLKNLIGTSNEPGEKKKKLAKLVGAN